jgi:hypothetical protein
VQSVVHPLEVRSYELEVNRKEVREKRKGKRIELRLVSLSFGEGWGEEK